MRERRRISLLLILAVLVSTAIFVLSSRFQAVEVDTTNAYFVSPSGNDSNAGTLGSPFKTITKARDTIKAAGKKGVHVYLRGGTYDLSSTVTFDSTNSGSSTAPNIYLNYPGERPILYASKSVPLTTGESGIKTVDLSVLGLSGKTITNVFFNGNREIAARFPNYTVPNFTAADPWAGDFLYATSASPQNTTQLAYNPAAIDPTGWTNVANGHVIVYSQLGYWPNTLAIQSVDTANHLITFQNQASYPIVSPNRFFVSGIPQLLNAPQEWYQDKNAGTLKFYLPATVKSGDSLRVSSVTDALSISSAQYLQFQGLEIRDADGSGVVVKDSGAITLNGLDIQDTTKDGILLSGTTHDTTVKNSFIAHTGGDGINVQPTLSYLQALNSMNITFNNNAIGWVGETLDQQQVGIAVHGVGVTAINNTVHDTPSHGILAYAAAQNTITSNRVYNTGETAYDTGGIYLLSTIANGVRTWIPRGNTITHNFVSDTGGYGWDTNSSSWRYHSYSWGIYLDDYTSSSTVSNNIVTRSYDACYLNHSGRANTYTNNVCYTTTNGRGQMELHEDNTYGSVDPKWQEVQTMDQAGYDKAKYFQAFPDLANVPQVPQPGTVMANNRIANNIFMTVAPSTNTILSFRNDGPSNTFSNNIYWASGRTAQMAGTLEDGVSHTWTVAQWQATGRDSGSREADPLFNNPGADDFGLRPGSPAASLGFKTINQAAIGTQGLTPAAPTLGGLSLINNQTAITGTFSSGSAQSFSIVNYQYKVLIGSASGSTLLDWTTTNSSLTSAPLKLAAGTTYVVCVREQSDAIDLGTGGLANPWSDPNCGNLIKTAAATTAPSSGSRSKTPGSGAAANTPTSSTPTTQPDPLKDLLNSLAGDGSIVQAAEKHYVFFFSNGAIWLMAVLFFIERFSRHRPSQVSITHTSRFAYLNLRQLWQRLFGPKSPTQT